MAPGERAGVKRVRDRKGLGGGGRERGREERNKKNESGRERDRTE